MNFDWKNQNHTILRGQASQYFLRDTFLPDHWGGIPVEPAEPEADIVRSVDMWALDPDGLVEAIQAKCDSSVCRTRNIFVEIFDKHGSPGWGHPNYKKRPTWIFIAVPAEETAIAQSELFSSVLGGLYPIPGVLGAKLYKVHANYGIWTEKCDKRDNAKSGAVGLLVPKDEFRLVCEFWVPYPGLNTILNHLSDAIADGRLEAF